MVATVGMLQASGLALKAPQPPRVETLPRLGPTPSSAHEEEQHAESKPGATARPGGGTAAIGTFAVSIALGTNGARGIRAVEIVGAALIANTICRALRSAVEVCGGMLAGIGAVTISGAGTVRVWILAARRAHSVAVAACCAFVLLNEGHDEVHGVDIDTLGNDGATAVAARVDSTEDFNTILYEDESSAGVAVAGCRGARIQK